MYVCFAFYFVCFVVSIVSPYVYYCSLPFVYKCKDHCHWVETQLQLMNNVLFMSSVVGKLCQISCCGG